MSGGGMGTHAAAAAGVDDELHRQELCLGWIYEFFARHRMEEAQEALIKSAEKKFHVSLASLQRHSDPISIIQQHLEKGEFELAHQEFDVWVEDFKPDVGEELYAETLQQITIQLALQPLRAEGGKNNLDAFAERVKKLFPEAGTRQGGRRTSGPSKLRAELLATTKKDVEKLLAKYSLSAFKEGTAQFWRVLRRAQKPTKLERVLQDIDEGKIPWEDSDEEEEATLASEASKRAAAASNSEGKGDAKPKEKEKEEGPKWLTLTAWELRQALNPEADPEDPAIFRAFTEIHQVSNEEVRNYVKKRRTKIEQPSAKSNKRDSREAPQAKAGAAKGVAAGSRADEADDEACVMGDEDEQVPATSVSKRRKVEAVVKAGVRGGVGGAAAQGGAKGNVNISSFVGDSTEEEEEEEEEAAAMVGRRGKAGGSDRGDNRGAQQDSKTISAKDQALINDLQDKRKGLGELCDDPLEAARVHARGAKGMGAGKVRIIDDNSKGRQMDFSDDDDEEDGNDKYKAVKASFVPRRDILACLPQSLGNVSRARGGEASKGGSGKHRKWQPAEEEALRKGVDEFGEGNWKKIQEGDSILKNRSAVDLKDKWRNLNKPKP